MIGGGCAGLAKERAAFLMRAQVTGVSRYGLAGQLTEAEQVRGEVRILRVHYGIRPIGSDHPSVPSRLADLAVMVERIERAFRSSQNFDVEALEQRAWTELWPTQTRLDLVEIEIGRCGRQAHIEFKNLGENPVE